MRGRQSLGKEDFYVVALDAERFKENMQKGAKGIAAEGREVVAGLPLGKQVPVRRRRRAALATQKPGPPRPWGRPLGWPSAFGWHLCRTELALNSLGLSPNLKIQVLGPAVDLDGGTAGPPSHSLTRPGRFRFGSVRVRRRRGPAAGGRRWRLRDRKSTRLNSSHITRSRMPSSA